MDVKFSCRCCLRCPPDKDLTTPYTHLGNTESYAGMLQQCFDIHLVLGNVSSGICWACVGRLRDASDFKLQVQRCQEELQEALLDNGKVGKETDKLEVLENINNIKILERKEEEFLTEKQYLEEICGVTVEPAVKPELAGDGEEDDSVSDVLYEEPIETLEMVSEDEAGGVADEEPIETLEMVSEDEAGGVADKEPIETLEMVSEDEAGGVADEEPIETLEMVSEDETGGVAEEDPLIKSETDMLSDGESSGAKVKSQDADMTETVSKQSQHVDDLEVPYSLREQVVNKGEINKAQPAETEENESHQSDFSPTDGSDFDPDNIPVHDEEYGTENEFYGDPIVKRTKKQLKNKCEKLSKKISEENKKFLKSSSKNIPEETNSPKTQKELHMEHEEAEENKCQNKSGNTKRSWIRRNACLYCQQVVTNFTRHLLRHHQKEVEVIQYKSIQDNDPSIRKMKRQEISDKIRNKGNFLHNSKVCFDRDGSLTLIPARRKDMIASPSSFATCKNCLGTFKRSTFYRHFRKCGTNSCNGRVLTKNSITIIPNTDTSEELKKKILPHLRSDETALVVKNDRLILSYGTRLLKTKKERQNRKVICSKMRDLATLLMVIRKHDCSIETLTDAVDPEKYEVFMASIKELCGFNEETGQVRVPSIPARILPAVLGCVDILFAQCLMSSESTAYKERYKKKLNEFTQLVTINCQWEISPNAEKTKKRRHMVKEILLPLEDDIKTVMETIAKLEVKYARKLKIDCNVMNYELLCTVTVTHIIMLDRKRAGNVTEAGLTFYINRKNEKKSEEVLETLTPDQRKSIKRLDVFQIPGKRTRSVPILLTKTMKENIDLIIACRDALKIPKTNALLFARPFTDEPFDGGKCLDKIKKLCNLKRPEMVTSTCMRHDRVESEKKSKEEYSNEEKNIKDNKEKSKKENEEDDNKKSKQKTKKRSLQDSSDDEMIVRRSKKTPRYWSDEEIKAVKFYFKEYIKKKINPGKAKCLEVLKKAPVLQSRTWMQLNSYVNNIYKNK